MLSESQRLSLEEAAARAEAQVDRVAAYLQGRGIAPQTARTYRLGYAADGEYAGRLAIPYITADGSVVDVRYRAIRDGQTPKYMSRGGSKTHLFSVASLLKPGPNLFITEGEIDCITLNQMGLNAVGVPGVQNWKDHYRLLMEDYDRIYIVCDGDEPGQKFGRQLLDRVYGSETIFLPEGEDVNSMYVNDRAGLESRLGL